MLAPNGRAFDAALTDPDFIADAKRMRAEIEPMTGEELAKIVNELVSAPPQVVARIKLLIEAKAGEAEPTKAPLGKGKANE